MDLSEEFDKHIEVALSAMMNEYFNRFEIEVQAVMRRCTVNLLNITEQKNFYKK